VKKCQLLIKTVKPFLSCEQGTLTEGEGSVRLTSLLFCKKENNFSVLKAAGLKKLVQGGQLYSSFPVSKDSLLIWRNLSGKLSCPNKKKKVEY
jgi:hypothetical protein